MTGWQEAVKEWTIILGLSFTALRGILQFCLKSSPDKLLKSHSEIKSHTQRIISGQQSSMGLYQTPTNSHISSFCNHQKTCVGWSISPLWFIAQLSREQEMTNPKICIFDPCCPVEQNVPCRIYPASHGSLDSFQRLSILKYQRLCDFFFVCLWKWWWKTLVTVFHYFPCSIWMSRYHKWFLTFTWSSAAGSFQTKWRFQEHNR